MKPSRAGSHGFSGMVTSRANSRHHRQFRTVTFRSRSICAMSDEARKKPVSPLYSADPMNETSVEPKSKSVPLLEKYERREGAFDEFLADDGTPRTQYAKLFEE